MEGMAERYESAADRLIREAQERGEFDNLPGAGKPLRIRNPNDPDWWVKNWIEREDLPMPLPTSLSLRKQAQTLIDDVLKLRSEQAVRDHVEAFNTRVLEARKRPVDGPPVVVRTFDVDEVLETWRDRRR
jgi:DnaJ-like protein